MTYRNWVAGAVMLVWPLAAGAQEPALETDFGPGRSHGHAHGTGHRHDHKHDVPQRRAQGARPASHTGRPDPNRGQASQEHRHGVETEYMFGFTAGSDIDGVGQSKVVLDTTAGFGKRSGRYAAVTNKLEIGHTPLPYLHLALGLATAHHSISGVSEFEDRKQSVFDGASLELKYRLLERGASPVGLTFIFEPHWARVEEGSGERVTKYAAEFKLALDAELLRDKVYAGFNLLYEPEQVRAHATGELEREATIGVSGALAFRVAPGLFLGGELRYLRSYEGLGLDRYAGDAWFAGPTLYAQLCEHCFVAASWSRQIAGRSVAEPGQGLNLDQFTGHQAKLRLGVHF